VNELFELINKKCFPLLEYWPRHPEQEFEQFADNALNFDLCCEDIDFESLRISYVAGLLFLFSGMMISWSSLRRNLVDCRKTCRDREIAAPECLEREANPKDQEVQRSSPTRGPFDGNPWLDKRIANTTSFLNGAKTSSR